MAGVGHDDNSPTGLTGTQGSLVVWSGVMGSLPQSSYEARMPPGLDEVDIDYATGLVLDPACAGDVIRVAVPRDALLEQAESCFPAGFDSVIDRFRDWWRRVTG